MISFVKEKEENYGKSLISIEEVDIKKNSTLLNVYGNLIDIQPLPISISDGNVHCYAIIEKFADYKITTVDLVYGAINLDRMNNDLQYRAEILEQFSRDKLEIITRERLGAMFQTPDMNYSSDLLRKAVLVAWNRAKENGQLYNGEIINKTRVNQGFGNSYKKQADNTQNSGKKASFFEKIANFYKAALIATPQNENKIEIYGKQSEEILDENTLAYGNMFFVGKTGATISNGVVCSKFTFLKRDFRVLGEERTFSDTTGTFLVSGLKDSQLKHNMEYRKKFLECIKRDNILDILLEQRKTRGVFLSYAGNFETDKDYLSVRPEVTDEFDEVSKLNSEYYKK